MPSSQLMNSDPNDGHRTPDDEIHSHLGSLRAFSINGTFKSNRNLGRGSCGTVTVGYLSGIDEEVAMKRLEIQHDSETPDKLGKLLEEIKTVKGLQHIYIIAYLGITLDLKLIPKSYECCIIMEHCSEGTVTKAASIWKNHPSGDLHIREQSIRYMTHLLVGLSYLHSMDLVHCDIKGENLVLANTSQGICLKIIDFDRTVRTTNGRLRSTEEVMAPGTVRYMAPEYVLACGYPRENWQNFGPLVDVYSAGCVLILMLTGKDPQYYYNDASMVTGEQQIRREVEDGDPMLYGIGEGLTQPYISDKVKEKFPDLCKILQEYMLVSHEHRLMAKDLRSLTLFSRTELNRAE